MSGILKPIWRLNRWFDDLHHEGRTVERGAWFAFLLLAIWVPPLPLKMAGYEQGWIEAVPYLLCLLFAAIRLRWQAIAHRVELA